MPRYKVQNYDHGEVARDTENAIGADYRSMVKGNKGAQGTLEQLFRFHDAGTQADIQSIPNATNSKGGYWYQHDRASEDGSVDFGSDGNVVGAPIKAEQDKRSLLKKFMDMMQ